MRDGHIQRDDLVRDVGARRRHLLRSPDVPLGDFGEPAALRGRPHGRFDEPFVGQAVEHHVDAGAVGVGQDLIREVRAARVVDIFHAHLAQRRTFVGAGGGEDGRTGLLCQLDRGQTDAAAGGVNEHAVTGFTFAQSNASRVVSAPAGMVAAAYRADPVRHRRQEMGRHIDPVANAPGMKPKTRWPTSNPVTPAPNSVTMPDEVTAADPPRIARIQAEHVEHVAEVQACGLNPDLHLARARRGHVCLEPDGGCRWRRVRSASRM